MEGYNFNLEDNINKDDEASKKIIDLNSFWQRAEKKEKIELIILVLLVSGTIFFLLLGLFDRPSRPTGESYSPELKEEILNP